MGFIGSNYVRHLLTSGREVSKVTVFDKFTYASNQRNLADFASDERLSIFRGDICRFDLLQEKMSNHDFVLHFAAESHVDRSILDPTSFVETNFLGTYNVLEAARVTGVKTIVHVSTDEVYGSTLEGSFEEKDLLAPNSPYSASKAGSDLLCRSYFVTHGLDVRVTRSCNNYGRFQYSEKVIPVMINSVLKEKNLPIYGSGKNVREWIHVIDHCKAIQLVLEAGNKGEIYNVGTGFHLTNLELASKILTKMGSNTSKVEFVEDRKGHDFRYSVNFDKLRNLGFNPAVNFEEGLDQTIRWYRENQDWWA